MLSEEKLERNMKRLKMKVGWLFFYYPGIWALLFCLFTFLYLQFGWGEYLVANYPNVITFLSNVFPGGDRLSNNSPRFRDELIPIRFFMVILLVLGLARLLYWHFRYRKLFIYYGMPLKGVCPLRTRKEIFKTGIGMLIFVPLFFAMLLASFFWGSDVFLLENQLDNDTRIYLNRDDVKFNTIPGFIHILFTKLYGPWMFFFLARMYLEFFNKCIWARKYDNQA